MEHEPLFGFAFEDFEALHVVAGAERCRHQGLGFAAGEDGRAVGARQDADFDPDVADLVEGARVRAPLLIDYLFAENSFAENFVISLQLGLCGFIFFRKRRDQDLLQFLDERVTLRLGCFSVSRRSDRSAPIFDFNWS